MRNDKENIIVEKSFRSAENTFKNSKFSKKKLIYIVT